MGQELISILEYGLQKSVIPTSPSEQGKGQPMDGTQFKDVSAQQNLQETYSIVDVSHPVEMKYSEAFQVLPGIDYTDDNVPFYEYPVFLEAYHHNTTSFNQQNVYSKSTLDFTLEEDPSIAEHSYHVQGSSTDAAEAWSEPSFVNSELPSQYCYSTYDPSACVSEDEYISCDFTQPIVNTNHSSIDLTVNITSEQSVQKDQHKPMAVSKSPHDELASNQSKVASIITGFDKLHNAAAATETPLLLAEEPKKSTQKRSRRAAHLPEEAAAKTSPTSVNAPKKPRIRKTLKPAVVSEWKCVPCNRMFRVKTGLLQHNTVYHSGAKLFNCNVCGKRYPDQKSALEHQRLHEVVDKPFKCDQCTRQYHHSYDLKRHIDLKHGVSQFNCKYCGKSFGRDDHVKRHETSHENGTVKRKRKNLDMLNELGTYINRL